MKRWTQEEVELLTTFVEMGYTHKEIAQELDRTAISIQHKCSRYNITNNWICKRKSHKQYVAELAERCPTMQVLESYVTDNTKILHKCLDCGAEYKCIPSDRLQGHSCKFCKKIAGYNISSIEPGITYLVYFSEIDIYKIGITSRTTKERNSVHGYKYEVILEHHFNTGKEAMQLEKEWLKNVQTYKINTGELRDGNTETFRL